MSTNPEPQDAIITDLLGQLNDSQREAYEERAGILEFDTGLSRGHAECLALLEVIRCYFILTKRG